MTGKANFKNEIHMQIGDNPMIYYYEMRKMLSEKYKAEDIDRYFFLKIFLEFENGLPMQIREFMQPC